MGTAIPERSSSRGKRGLCDRSAIRRYNLLTEWAAEEIRYRHSVKNYSKDGVMNS